jgi:hypothetical protein
MTKVIELEDLVGWEPTQTEPGSKQKMAILSQRIAKGQPAHHPDDLAYKMPLTLRGESLDLFLEAARQIDEEAA